MCCAPVAEGLPLSGVGWLLSRAALGTPAPLPHGATGVPAAYTPPGPGRAVLRPAHGRLNFQYTATLRRAVGSGDPLVDCHTPVGSGQWILQSTAALCRAVDGGHRSIQLPRRLGATAVGQWAVELLRHTAALPGGSGQLISSCTLSHCLGAVRGGTPSGLCLTALGQWAVELVLYYGGAAGPGPYIPPPPPTARPPPSGF